MLENGLRLVFWSSIQVRFVSNLTAELKIIYHSKVEKQQSFVEVDVTLPWRDVLPFSIVTIDLRIVVSISFFASPIICTTWSCVLWDGQVIVILARGWLLVFTPVYTQQVITIIAPHFLHRWFMLILLHSDWLRPIAKLNFLIALVYKQI